MRPLWLSSTAPPPLETTPMPYELYIVRHAIAAERGDAWPDDDKRPLTTRGVHRFKDSLGGFKWLDASIDEIFSSPLVRAKQTADLLAAVVGTGVKTLDALAPGNTPAVVIAQLAKAAKRQRIALVGHEPGLGELAAHLIGASHPLTFKKGGVCRIDLGALSAKKTGSLVWFVTPKMLRGLAT